ncbi:MAG: PAS domain-containing sensor histidine kinase [Alphaproteobacteria bacterium]|nr:PAS domain-containing sensor histidine kinase [Alphaproteobacteria bacterium]
MDRLENTEAVDAEKVPVGSVFSVRTLLGKAFSGIHLSQIKYRSWRTKAGILLVVAAIISGFSTYGALTQSPPFGNNPDTVIWLLNVDLVILLLLVSLIAKRIVSVWSSKKRGIAGSHLHVRLVYIFSVLVAVPTIIMAVFSALLFHYGVQAWFNQRVQTAINESSAVAQSYLEEHKQVIRADTMAMAGDLDRQGYRLMLDEHMFSKVIDTQSLLRNLSEALVITRDGRVLARSALTFTLEYELPSDFAFKQAGDGDVVLMMNEDQDRVRALTKLVSIPGTYLYVGRMVDPQVLSHLSATDMAVQDYNNLQARYSGMRITVLMLFVVVALLLLLAAIWSGLLLAKQLVSPIGELVQAADRVRAGDLSSCLPTDTGRIEEFEYLAKSFNRMTSQLQSQRDALIDANLQIDQRRRLIETVLVGVSSGVIGVDGQGVINLANNSASDLLGKSHEQITGYYILDIIPELKEMLDDISKKPKKMVQKEIPVFFKKRGRRSFLFRISIELIEKNMAGLIITFDDITELQSAQRKAAWSDVARRIAHEIKNPLTPIQLSAERLKRKYLKEIKNNPETFEQCTDTIIKHVGDIGHMVDEFSSFARMPTPTLKIQDIAKHIEEALILTKQAHDAIVLDINNIAQNSMVNCDGQQIRQVMNNLLKNAVESIQMRSKKDLNAQQGEISVLIAERNKEELFISITDSGIGLPGDEDIAKLTEPYITHKPKGTGLGLAIVKKIIEDHNGSLIIGAPEWLETMDIWESKGGACFVVTLPLATFIETNNNTAENEKEKPAQTKKNRKAS